MKPEIAEFNAGLEDKLNEIRDTVPAIDELGYALKDETERLYAAARAIERRDAAAKHLLSTLRVLPPTPASEAKRALLTDEITATLPKMFQPSATEAPVPVEPSTWNFRERMTAAAGG